MTGSAVVTTRLSSATMNSAIDVIANVQAAADRVRSCVMSVSSVSPYLSVTKNGRQKKGP